jgi:hypothetical protein
MKISEGSQQQYMFIGIKALKWKLWHCSYSSSIRSTGLSRVIGLAQTLRSWLEAGVIQDSVMDVADLSTKIHREEDLDTVKDDFDGDSEDADEGRWWRRRIRPSSLMTNHSINNSIQFNSIQASTDQFNQPA